MYEYRDKTVRLLYGGGGYTQHSDIPATAWEISIVRITRA